MSRLARILLPLLILAMGWFGYTRLKVKEPPKQRTQKEQQPIRTEVMEIYRGDFQTTVRTQGVVRPHNEAVLAAQVAGKVIEVSEKLQDGAFFEEGEVMLRLDEEDFQAAIISARANLARAQSAFAQEETKAKQARLNWEDLGYEEEPNELVLRLPQLREAEANVASAEAGLARAERDLARAEVRAPFAGRVLERSVTIGQSVTPNTTLATVFTTDSAEVRLPVAPRDMAFLTLPERTGDAPVPVRFTSALGDGSDTVWEGLITGTGGALDPDSRELFAIALVEDPFSLQADETRPPLRIGQPVVGEIDAEVLREVFVIPRKAVRSLDMINTIDAEELTLHRIEIVPIFSNETELVILGQDLPSPFLLATSKLVYAPEGGKVEILEPPSPEEGEAETEEGEVSTTPARHHRGG